MALMPFFFHLRDQFLLLYTFKYLARGRESDLKQGHRPLLWSVVHCSEEALFLAPGNLAIIVPPPPQLLMEHSSRKAGVSPVRQQLLGELHPILGQDCNGKSPVHRVPWGRAWVGLKKGTFTNKHL